MLHYGELSEGPGYEKMYPRRVVVKFREGTVSLPYEDSAERSFDEKWRERWQDLSGRFGDIHLGRLFVSIDPERIRNLNGQATKLDPTYEPIDPLTFFAIELPPGMDPAPLAEILNGWEEIVEYAYVESPPVPAPAQPTGVNPALSNQRYLDEPRVGVLGAADIGGINARAAWAQDQPVGVGIGGGGGVSYIVIDKGWNLDHEDLIGAQITLHAGVNAGVDPDDKPHGTRVLGILAAQDNGLGGVGIAYRATGRVVSGWPAPGSPLNWANAIITAIDALEFGDVLLLEAQIQFNGGPYLPLELEPANFAAIRLATALGIIVVEPAGNGNALLDFQTDNRGNNPGKLILNRNHADFKDSGAILVAAADPVGDQANSWPTSNRGSRVDCFAWGSQVTTTDTDAAGVANGYTNAFGATSAASAIVAGAAIVVQGIVQHPQRLGRRLNAFQMRLLLKNPITGTLSAGSSFGAINLDGIGVMPNLGRIIGNTANLLPDVVIRDHLSDNGDPHTRLVALSPDIIVRPANTVTNPQVTFGSAASIGSYNPIPPIRTDTDYDIFVRVFNRGPLAASGVQATVYWASPATNQLRPDLWTRIDSSVPANVAAGITTMTVLPRIRWLGNQIPAPGQCAFIVTVGCLEDPDPLPDPMALINPANPAALAYDKFLDLMRWNNNISRKSFYTITMAPSNQPVGIISQPASLRPIQLSIDFLAPGAYDLDRLMQLEIVARLPKGAQLWLEGPAAFVNAMVKGHYERVRQEKMQLPLCPYGGNRFEEMVFPAKSINPLRIQVSVPGEYRAGMYEIYVRHLYKGEEIGRLTWQLVPKSTTEENPLADSLRRLFARITPLSCLLALLLLGAFLIILYLLVA